MGEKNILNKDALFSEIKEEFMEIYGQHKDDEAKIISSLKKSKVLKNKSLVDLGGLRGQERKDAISKIVEIIYNHFTKEKKVEAPTINVEESNNNILETLLEKRMKINLGGGGARGIETSRGNPVTLKNLYRANTGFNPDSIDAFDSKGKRPIKLLDSQVSNALLSGLKGKYAPVLKRNIKSLIATIREVYDKTEDDTIEYVEIDMSNILDKTTMTDLSKRKVIYDYWKEIHGKFPKIIKSIEDLSSKLEKIAKKESADETLREDINNFLKVANKIEDIKYVVEVPQKQITIGDIDGRAEKALEQFLAQLGMLATQTDDSNIDIKFEQAYTNTGERKEFHSIGEQLGLSEEKVEEVEDLTHEIKLDPLSILYLKRDLGEIAEVFNDFDFEDTVKELYYKMNASKPIQLIQEKGMDELFDRLLETKKIITKYDADKIHLPIFLFESKELRQDYGDEASKSATVKETINEFFRAFADLLEEVRTTFSSFADIQQFGKEPKGVKPQKPEGGYKTTREGLGIERYIYGQEGREGKTRKDYKIFLDVMGDINKVGELIAELFVAPMNLPSVNAGEKLPFSINGHLRIISAIIDFKGGEGKIKGGGFLPYKVMSKLMRKFQLTFIDNNELKELIPFLKSVNTGEIFSSVTKAEEKAKDFKEALLKIYQSEAGMEEVIDRDIASMFGAINKTTNKIVLEEFEGVNASKAYEQTSIDNVTEITPVMVLVDALEQAKDNEALRLRNKEIMKTIEEFLGEAKKLSPMKKSELYYRLLEAHDSLRILKGKEVHYATRDENNFDHVEGMLIKMQQEHNLDMSAGELVSIVNEIDSFDNISKAHGINSEHVYLIKANFR